MSTEGPISSPYKILVLTESYPILVGNTTHVFHFYLWLNKGIKSERIFKCKTSSITGYELSQPPEENRPEPDLGFADRISIETLHITYLAHLNHIPTYLLINILQRIASWLRIWNYIRDFPKDLFMFMDSLYCMSTFQLLSFWVFTTLFCCNVTSRCYPHRSRSGYVPKLCLSVSPSAWMNNPDR